MSWERADFSRGVVALFELAEADRARVAAAMLRLRAMIDNREGNHLERKAALDATADPAPLWWQIVGFNPWRDRGVSPGERRAGIGRLIRVVETVYRAEVKTVKEQNGTGGQAASGTQSECKEGVTISEERVTEGPAVPAEAPIVEGSFANRISGVLERVDSEWNGGEREPLAEICFYLGLPKTKLSELCLMRTGLKAMELGDSIRVEGMKAILRAKFRPLVKEWMESLERDAAGSIAEDFTHAAWRFLKWMRGGGRNESRQKLAWEVGVPTRGRLGRAVFVSERNTIEELEIAAAIRVIQEAMDVESGPRVGAPDWLEDAPGAGLGEVGDAGDETREEEERWGIEGADGELGRESA